MTVLALGKFNALHRGHHSLVTEGQQYGDVALLNLAGMAKHFGWTPRAPLLDSVTRSEILQAWGASELTIPFPKVQALSAEEFLTMMAHEYQINHIICGENCAIGRDRHADAAWLKHRARDFGLGVTVMPLLKKDDIVVSSSHIRQDLAAGDITAVTKAMGRPYRLRGTVVQGDGRGRTIGVPTANISGISNQLPASGVYATTVTLPDQRSYRAAVNIGTVPTAGDDRALSVEAHMLDFDGDCYGQELVVDLIQYLRPEQRFDSFDALVSQIRRDIEQVRLI